ncbi:hypothetical protein DNTS_011387 [Danionella cerebrum]|uniref:PH domain-containing protein n=1 Tax=Danionella cerebrum TaxID=2873325 RepID=A0A553PZD2_9TELE|nr:hypothetical protein DNTS_011387 [Danionella translucida]
MYFQDSAGMKMWKKRWFVLCDMCLFYYRDEKEEGILGSILLPSFHISMLSVDDHISRKYAFKATHPNMRTYYFSTDTAKDMESWMKVMTDASLVHGEPAKRLEKIKVEPHSPQELNNMLNHRILTRPEIQNNERNRETTRQDEKKPKPTERQASLQKDREIRVGLQKERESRASLQKKDKDSRVIVQRDGEKYTDNYTLHKEAQRLAQQKDPERYMLQKDVEKCILNKDLEKCALHKDGENYLQQKDGQIYFLHKDVRDGGKYKEPEKILQKDSRYTLQRDGDKAKQQKDLEKPVPPPREGDMYGFQKEGTMERPLTKINSIKLQPAQAAAIAAAVSSSRQMQVQSAQFKPPLVNGSEEMNQRNAAEPERSLSRTSSMQQLEHWVRTQRTRPPDEDTRSITSYQTLPRNMPSHRAQVTPRYPEGYRTLPRNVLRPESICSVSGSVYDQALQPSTAEKRRSIRDDTMWQLYEWQQRQAHSRLGYGTLPSPKTKTLGQISESIPSSPSHGSLAGYQTFSPNRPLNPDARSEVSSPALTIERRHRPHHAKFSYPAERRPVPPAPGITAQSLQGKTSEILSHHLQRNLMYLDSQMKENEPVIFMIHAMIENSAPRPQLYQQQISPEEYRENSCLYRPEELDVDTKLSRLCEQDKVVRTQEEKLQQLHREKHTLETVLLSASQELEMSSESAAVSVQSLIQQKDVLQSGLLSTCRELSRVNNELERSWREYDRLEADVTLAKSNLLEQLEALGSPQTEPPSQKHVQIQKELWRIQDVMEALSKNKPKRNAEPSFPGANPLSSLQKSEESDSVPPRPPLPFSYEGSEHPLLASPSPVQPQTTRTTPHRPEERKNAQRNGTHTGPDYRLYKSEPELTTVAEVDESNGEDKSEQTVEKQPHGVTKGAAYPVGVVSPRTKSPMPESSTIASYVTLRKSKKPDPRTCQVQDRPRSAVEHMNSSAAGVDFVRTRMSVEEQMERIRRHQQGALRERRRDENTLSRSQSFTKDTIYYTLQARKKGPVMTPDELDERRALKHIDAEENYREDERVLYRNSSSENKERVLVSRSVSMKESLLRSVYPKPMLNREDCKPTSPKPVLNREEYEDLNLEPVLNREEYEHSGAKPVQNRDEFVHSSPKPVINHPNPVVDWDDYEQSSPNPVINWEEYGHQSPKPVQNHDENKHSGPNEASDRDESELTSPEPVSNQSPEITNTLEFDRKLTTQNSLQTAIMVRVGTEDDEDEDDDVKKPPDQEADVSFEITNSKHGMMMSVLSTPPQSPSSSSSPPPPPSPPQLTDGSHFIERAQHMREKKTHHIIIISSSRQSGSPTHCIS